MKTHVTEQTARTTIQRNKQTKTNKLSDAELNKQVKITPKLRNGYKKKIYERTNEHPNNQNEQTKETIILIKF